MTKSNVLYGNVPDKHIELLNYLKQNYTSPSHKGLVDTLLKDKEVLPIFANYLKNREGRKGQFKFDLFLQPTLLGSVSYKLNKFHSDEVLEKLLTLSSDKSMSPDLLTYLYFQKISVNSQLLPLLLQTSYSDLSTFAFDYVDGYSHRTRHGQTCRGLWIRLHRLYLFLSFHYLEQEHFKLFMLCESLQATPPRDMVQCWFDSNYLSD